MGKETHHNNDHKQQIAGVEKEEEIDEVTQHQDEEYNGNEYKDQDKLNFPYSDYTGKKIRLTTMLID